MILIIIAIFFALGYIAIALEHPIKINKAATALILGTFLWLIWFMASGSMHGVEGLHRAEHQLFENFGHLTQILFFLMGAMTIVVIVDANNGFSIITSKIRTDNTRTLIWIISWVAFFLSAILDNLTTTIVMVTLSRKLISDKKIRLYFAGLIVIAANAGGAWSPIGDITTTMLWIGGQISALTIIKSLILPSIISLLFPLIIISFFIKGKICQSQVVAPEQNSFHFDRNLLFIIGVGGLLMVPVIKTTFHVPPYIAMLFVLGILFTAVEFLKRKYHQDIPQRLNIHQLVKDMDLPSVLFFAGILLAVGVLGATGQLAALAKMLDNGIGDIRIIVFIIGILSAIVDNVPLVAATMNMYSLQDFHTDHLMWEFIAFCAGTGGSMLVIGSAAGVAAMGIDKNLSFGWYLKKITPLAILGYVVGSVTYLIVK
jgi:Na+/H+ antiporter NhaD/arsenite permease-like protein